MIAVAADHHVPLAHVLRIAAEQPVLVHDQHAEPVARVEQLRRGRIVRGANAVAAEFLQLVDAEFLQRIGNGRANAGVVLVIAGAVNRVRLAVQHETLVRIKDRGADAEDGFLLVNRFAVHRNRGDELVELGRFRRPEHGRRNLRLQLQRGLQFAAHLLRSLELRDRLAVRRNDFAVHHRVDGVGEFVEHVGFDVDCRRARRHVVLELGINENPVRRDGHRRGLLQPGVAINARAFVEPALELRRVHLHGDDVALAELHHVRDVLAERVIAALVPAHDPAVDKNRRVAIHAIERQPDALAFIRLRQLERAAIPADAVRLEARPERPVAVVHVGVFVERQFNRPIVRQIHRAPRTSLNNFSEAGPVFAPALSSRSALGQSSPR